MESKLLDWFIQIGLSHNLAILLKTILYLLVLVLICWLSNLIVRKIIVRSLSAIIHRTKNTWDDIFVKNNVFSPLSHLVPALIIFYSTSLVFKDYPVWIPVVKDAAYLYIIIVSIIVVNSFLKGLHKIYNTLPVSKNRPIEGYVQVVQILAIFIGVMLIISVLFNTNLGKLFAGLGALAAVLLLIFKDTILGFVSSIQLSANKMVKPGDWIDMPGRNADGIVQEINLNTVKVQNWDKTISTIPTYALVSESFQNWKGMEESGGRRIKRSINIDMSSIRFCNDEMIEKFKKIHLLRAYVKSKEQEIVNYNEKHKIDPLVTANGRRMTNIGTFRKYVEAYLQAHPLIHNKMTFLVRQLQPTERGLPIEIYVFSKDQRWANYEAIQADIFDHILSVIPEFYLRVFQNPTGNDFSSWGSRTDN